MPPHKKDLEKDRYLSTSGDVTRCHVSFGCALDTLLGPVPIAVVDVGRVAEIASARAGDLVQLIPSATLRTCFLMRF
ncbi:MAG: hypothetical protein Q7T05_08855, partial [Dehalococcoidia bacterium]|nr:hypothetical protein [Dehalococcoidia bacterium]